MPWKYTQLKKRLRPEVRAVLREWNECITADFTEEEKEQFKDLLARAAERAQQRLDEMKKE